MLLEEPRVLPDNYTNGLIGAINRILNYYKQKPDFFSQYAVMDERLKSRKKGCWLKRTNHLMHSHEFTRKNWKEKFEKNNQELDKMLAEYRNKISSRKFSSFETGITIGHYMGRYDIEEVGVGCAANSTHSRKLIIPSIYVDARSLTNEKGKTKQFCKSLVDEIKDNFKTRHVMAYESIEHF